MFEDKPATCSFPCLPTLDPGDEPDFVDSWQRMSLAAHTTATNHGFTGMDINTQLLRIHSEVSEASEAVRDGKLPSKKIPDFSALEEELADAVIRIMDLGYKHNLYIGHALAAKMWYNQNRPHLHGRANQ